MSYLWGLCISRRWFEAAVADMIHPPFISPTSGCSSVARRLRWFDAADVRVAERHVSVGLGRTSPEGGAGDPGGKEAPDLDPVASEHAWA